MNDMTSLDNYNILDLLGLADIEESKKDRLLLNMNNYIWQEFIFTRLDKVLTNQQLREVAKMVQENIGVDKILEFISSKVPNFNQLYLEYAREGKLRIIQNQINDVLKDIEDQLQIQPQSYHQVLIDKKAKCQKAKQLAGEGNWEQLKTLMSKAA